MAGYVVNKLISDFHNVPRYGTDLTAVSNSFTLDFDGNGRGYREWAHRGTRGKEVLFLFASPSRLDRARAGPFGQRVSFCPTPCGARGPTARAARARVRVPRNRFPYRAAHFPASAPLSSPPHPLFHPTNPLQSRASSSRPAVSSLPPPSSSSSSA
jgi:hypothetical protein